jgi:hydrogen peroxide-dependent heme synthase
MATEAFPPVPLTLEGAALLHQMMRVRWAAWSGVSSEERRAIVAEASSLLAPMENNTEYGSAIYSMLGHKADLLFIHFREDFQQLSTLEWEISKLRLWQYLEPTTSYVSVVELGLYESSVKSYQAMLEKGLQPHSEEWNKELAETLQRQRTAMKPRLYQAIPSSPYICFYPMDRLRGEENNWYTVPMLERRRMMEDHGAIGRRYAGIVKQIISGSIGLDDWEWGVDLWADDPVWFKKLIYEMRFDEVSAVYAKFGQFYVGTRLPVAELATRLSL